MVRRIVEEDVTTPTSNTTVVEGDGSWVGRTLVALVVLAVLIVGGIYLVRAINNNNGSSTNNPSNGPGIVNNNTNNNPNPIPSGGVPS